MSVTAGTRLGPYEVVSRIGAGGMGEVWRARDARLDRSVAIKILPGEFAANAQLKLRFEREAKTISQLNHPHICTLHDVGHDSGVDYLVLELIEGETIADRLARGPMPLADVLRYGTEIAEALDRAHRAGIVHRDLKPGNVMLTRSGTKLLDFGLAKSDNLVPGDDGATVHKALTQEGTILGTFQYMAPEQFEGTDADARTDIFALGALLYEMATGHRAFEGKTKTSLIAAIVGGEPKPLSAVQPLAPDALQHVIAKCLEKDPDERWQSAHDVATELRWIAEAGSSPSMQIARVDARRRRVLRGVAWGAAGVVVGALLTAAAWRFVPARVERPVMRFDLPTPATAPMLVSRYSNLAISPDGRTIAYVGLEGETARLYLRRLDRLGATPLAGTEGARAPFFSPDGRWIAYSHGGGKQSLDKVSVDGGAPVTISNDQVVLGAWWDDDGTIYYVRQFPEGICRLVPGGKPEVIARPDTAKGDRALVHPQPVPGGKYILATAWTGASFDEARIVAYPLGKGQRKVIVEGGSYGRIVSSGHLVFVRGGALFAAPFDAKRVEVTGPPVAVIDNVYAGIANGEAYVSEARNGTLLYAPGIHSSPPRQLVWVDRSGKETPLVPTLRQYANPSIAPDGGTIAVGIQEAKFDIWMIDLDRDVATRLSFGEDDGNPVISPDGTKVVYNSSRDGAINLWVRSADGSGAETKISNAKNEVLVPTGWVGNDRVLYTSQKKNSSDVLLLPAKPGATPVPVLVSAFDEGGARMSPDGEWLLYSSNESGRTEIYIQKFPAAGGKTQVSVGGGSAGVWSRSGREIFYVNEQKRLMVVDLETSPRVRVSRPRVILDNDSYALDQGYEISRDDQKILVVKMDPSQQLARDMVLVVNWDEELKRRVPNGR